MCPSRELLGRPQRACGYAQPAALPGTAQHAGSGNLAACAAADSQVGPQEGGNNGFRDSNTYAQHFHGLWGNPGTNNVPCDGPLQEGSLFCVRGDNVFADVLPGDCGEWQYDVALEHAPGNYWCAWGHSQLRGARSAGCQMPACPSWLRMQQLPATAAALRGGHWPGSALPQNVHGADLGTRAVRQHPRPCPEARPQRCLVLPRAQLPGSICTARSPAGTMHSMPRTGSWLQGC